MVHDLILLTDIPSIVQTASVKHGLNKAQTKALAKLEQVSDKAFHDVTQKGSIHFKDQNNNLLPKLKLNGFSAREIQTFAEDLEKTIQKNDQKNHELFNKIHQAFKGGSGISDITQKYFVPQPLVWSVILQKKTDQERFKDLNWGLRTWDNWYFNDVDNRFVDDWPGRIPAQLVAHTLFFTKENDLVFDPMAGGGVLADTCLAFNRRYWSFDLFDRIKTRPEIEPFLGP